VSSNLEVLISLGFKKGEIAELDNVIKKLRELEAKGVKLADVTTKAEVQKESWDTRRTMEDIKESLFKQKVKTDNTDVLNEIGKLDSNINQLQYNLFAHAIFPKASNVGIIKNLQGVQGRAAELMGEFVKGKSGRVLEGLTQEEYVDRYAPMMERIIDETMEKIMRGVSPESLANPLAVINMLRDPSQANAFFSRFKNVMVNTFDKEENVQIGGFGLKGRNSIAELSKSGLQMDMLHYTTSMENKELDKRFGITQLTQISEEKTKQLQDLATKDRFGIQKIDNIEDFLPITRGKNGLEYKQFKGNMLIGDKLYEQLKTQQEKILSDEKFSKEDIKIIMDHVFRDRVPDIFAAIINRESFEKTTAKEIADEYMEKFPDANRANVDQIAEMIIKNRARMIELEKQGFTGVTIIPLAKTGTMTKFWEEVAKNPILYKILQENILSMSGTVGTPIVIPPTKESTKDFISNFDETKLKQLDKNYLEQILDTLLSIEGTAETLKKKLDELNTDRDKINSGG